MLKSGKSLMASVLAAAAADIGAPLTFREEHHFGRTRYPAGWKAYRAGNFDPRVNRHTGKPHEHRREIARNLARTAPRPNWRAINIVDLRDSEVALLTPEEQRWAHDLLMQRAARKAS